MLEQVRELIKNKKVAILGFGREGLSTLHFLEKAGGFKSLTIVDLNPVKNVSSEYATVTGADYQKDLDAYDVVFKSPGIVLEKDFNEYRANITSQTEQFLTAYRRQTIGITGTKGKSTTTSLLYHVLKESGKNAILMGNIGIPCFDCFEMMGEDAIAVFEMSSHQLEFTRVSPFIGVLLNVHEEHLDHYGTFEKYKAAKCNVFNFQEKEDDLYINLENVDETRNCVAFDGSRNGKYELASHIHTIAFSGMSLSHEETRAHIDPSLADIRIDANATRITGMCEDYVIPTDRIQLLGHHNYFNIGVAYAIASKLGISQEAFESALCTFEPLPHRLKLLGEKEGIRFYDDSISTICETTIQALQSVDNVGTLLIGGMDRGIDYEPLIQYLLENPVDHIICMYATGKRIFERIVELGGDEAFEWVEDLETATKKAIRLTEKGKACLLSPAAASYGYFKNFEERGDKFKEYVGL